eukprot:s1371_g11.t1
MAPLPSLSAMVFCRFGGACQELFLDLVLWVGSETSLFLFSRAQKVTLDTAACGLKVPMAPLPSLSAMVFCRFGSACQELILDLLDAFLLSFPTTAVRSSNGAAVVVVDDDDEEDADDAADAADDDDDDDADDDEDDDDAADAADDDDDADDAAAAEGPTPLGSAAGGGSP